MSDQIGPADQPSAASIAMHDARTLWRCPQLGGPVTFGYCRRCNQTLPCGKMAMCWAGRIDVDAFLGAFYSPEEQARIHGASRGRMDIVSETLLRVLNNQDKPTDTTS